MNAATRSHYRPYASLCATVLLFALRTPAAEPTILHAHAFVGGRSPLAVGSQNMQITASIVQRSPNELALTAPTYVVSLGFQPMILGLDTDRDGIPDAEDWDDDGDGLSDSIDPRPYDSDNDGKNNFADNDDDNDGLDDGAEAVFGTSWITPNTDADPHDDFQEWIAGTDGCDPNDFFHIAALDLNTSMMGISWNALSSLVLPDLPAVIGVMPRIFTYESFAIAESWANNIGISCSAGSFFS